MKRRVFLHRLVSTAATVPVASSMLASCGSTGSDSETDTDVDPDTDPVTDTDSDTITDTDSDTVTDTDSETDTDTDTDTDTITGCSAGDAEGYSDSHNHIISVSEADVLAGIEKTYQSTESVVDGHKHLVTITAKQFAELALSCSVIVDTDDPQHPHGWQINIL